LPGDTQLVGEEFLNPETRSLKFALNREATAHTVPPQDFLSSGPPRVNPLLCSSHQVTTEVFLTLGLGLFSLTSLLSCRELYEQPGLPQLWSVHQEEQPLKDSSLISGHQRTQAPMLL
jgi:hypothetical protein